MLLGNSNLIFLIKGDVPVFLLEYDKLSISDWTLAIKSNTRSRQCRQISSRGKVSTPANCDENEINDKDKQD